VWNIKKKTTTIQKARLTHTSDVQSFGNGCNIVTLLYAGNSSFTFFLLFPSSERNSALGFKVLYLTAAMPREGKGISSIPEILLKFKIFQMILQAIVACANHRSGWPWLEQAFGSLISYLKISKAISRNLHLSNQRDCYSVILFNSIIWLQLTVFAEPHHSYNYGRTKLLWLF